MVRDHMMDADPPVPVFYVGCSRPECSIIGPRRVTEAGAADAWNVEWIGRGSKHAA